MEAATQTQSIPQSIPQKPAEEFAVAANLAPQTDAEKKAVECFVALGKAEHTFRPGIEFGEAMIALRCEIKATKGRDWMLRLEQLGITYAKARYWMDVAEGKQTHRGKVKDNAEEKPANEWNAAMYKLLALRDDVKILLNKSENPDDSKVLVDPLRQLGDLIGCQMVSTGGDNEWSTTTSTTTVQQLG